MIFVREKFIKGQFFSKYFSGGDEKRGLAQESRSQAKRSPDPQVKYNPYKKNIFLNIMFTLYSYEILPSSV